MTEAELQAAVTELCDQRELYWKDEPDARRSKRGWPDLVILGSTSALFVELKSEDGRRSMAQVETATRIVCAGLEYVLWRPLHLRNGQIAAALDRLAGL